MKNIHILLLTFFLMLTNYKAQATIYGTLGACVGSTAALHGDTSALGPGTWSSSIPTIATIDAFSGVVTALSAGTTLITYTNPSGTTTEVFTVSNSPGPISGGTVPFCAGTTVSLSVASSGGTWSSMHPCATVGSTSGIVTGVFGGVAPIHYNAGVGCYTQRIVTVNSLPMPVIDSVFTSIVCTGNTISFTSPTPGGTWASSNTSVATIGASSGTIGGISPGTAMISYTVSGACGLGTSTRMTTVVSSISAGTITGPTSVNAGFFTTLGHSLGGGTWSSSNSAVATIDAMGYLSGIAAGTCIISYTSPGCTSPIHATTIFTVNVADCISGSVLFPGSPYYGWVRIWLIKYNPSTMMLTASDSTMAFSSGGSSQTFHFCGLGTDSFRLKSATMDTTGIVSATGHLPTYHVSSPFWNTATVIHHISGTHDFSKNIIMGYGTPTSGPGFIAGNVTTGANKGTADGAPAVNLLVYCINNATGEILQQAYTNSSGQFSFSNLPLGLPMKIYPEHINYATTPYPPITLTSSTPSMGAANFVQHTLSHTITPNVVGVTDNWARTKIVSVFPNPAKGTVYLKWETNNVGAAVVSIADFTGRQVLSQSVNMDSAGTICIKTETLCPGLYIMSVNGNGFTEVFKLNKQ